jgi:type I restriction enzyme M protein
VSEPPLLGVAGHWGSAEISLARRFNALHQLIYTRGGIRPSNAAVEEVAKLALIRLYSLGHPSADLGSSVRAGDLFRPGVGAEAFASAFAKALASPSLVAVDPAGRSHPIWPPGEPFRLTDDSVLVTAAALIADILDDGTARASDPLGTAFDALLAGRYDHAGGLGTYLTPSGVARMMAEIAADLVDSSTMDGPGFGDPYCGTGRFLVAMLEVLRERGQHQLLGAGPFGADQSASSVAKARINMLLYGVHRPLVWTVRDSVTDSDLDRLNGTVPLILTNPPFGEGKYDDPVGLARTASAIPRLAGRGRIDPSLACLARALRLLAPGGVLGIVLPDGVAASPAFADLVLGRASPLAAEVDVAANVSLPTATFALSGTVAKTSAVFIRRARPPRHVVLARVEHVGYLRQGGRAGPDPEGNELPTVSHLVRDNLARAGEATLTIASTDPLVAVAAADSLRTLDPSRLDPVAMQARRLIVGRGGVELRRLLRARKATPARQAEPPYISVLHVDELGTVDWHAVSDHAPITPGRLVQPGDVIVSLLNPSKLRAAVIPPQGGPIQVSGEFGVFTASCDPYAVLGILYSRGVRAQLSPLGRGTSSSRRRIDVEDVLSLVVPNLSGESLRTLGRSVRDGELLVNQGRERLRRQFASLDATDSADVDSADTDSADTGSGVAAPTGSASR